MLYYTVLSNFFSLLQPILPSLEFEVVSYKYHAEYAATVERLHLYGGNCSIDPSVTYSICNIFLDEYNQVARRLNQIPDMSIQNFTDVLVRWKPLKDELVNQYAFQSLNY